LIIFIDQKANKNDQKINQPDTIEIHENYYSLKLPLSNISGGLKHSNIVTRINEMKKKEMLQ